MSQTYLNACLSHGHIARWHKSQMPLKVFIEPFEWYDFAVSFDEETYHRIVTETCHSWTTLSKGLVHFLFVDTPDTSDIQIRWRHTSKTILSRCYRYIDEQYAFKSVIIRVNLAHPNFEEREGEERLFEQIFYELGSALGVPPRFKNPHPQKSLPKNLHQESTGSISALSPSTIETLYKLYEFPIGLAPCEELKHETEQCPVTEEIRWLTSFKPKEKPLLSSWSPFMRPSSNQSIQKGRSSSQADLSSNPFAFSSFISSLSAKNT